VCARCMPDRIRRAVIALGSFGACGVGAGRRAVARRRLCDHLAVSYDLAVWEGERPESDEQALRIHKALYNKYIASRVDIPPTPLIAGSSGSCCSAGPS